MQICGDHWNRLREKVKEAGLYGFVSANGEEAAKKLQRELGGEQSIDTYDPLMGAHNAILGNMLDLFGLQVMADGCPLCKANAGAVEHQKTCTEPTCLITGETPYDKWLDFAVRDQVQIVKEMQS